MIPVSRRLRVTLACMLTCGCTYIRSDIPKLLLSLEAHVRSLAVGYFHAAIVNNDLNAVHDIITRQPSLIDTPDPVTGDTALHAASRDKNTSSQILSSLLQTSSHSVHTYNKKGKPPLWLAVKNLSIEKVEMLLRYGADPDTYATCNLETSLNTNLLNSLQIPEATANTLNTYITTSPIGYVCAKQITPGVRFDQDQAPYEITYLLLQYGANPHQQAIIYKEHTVVQRIPLIHMAVPFAQLSDIILAFNADPNATDMYGRNILHIMMLQTYATGGRFLVSHVKTVLNFILNNVNVNHISYKNETPLTLAIEKLSENAPYVTRGRSLHNDLQNIYRDMRDMLLQYGADPYLPYSDTNAITLDNRLQQETQHKIDFLPIEDMFDTIQRIENGASIQQEDADEEDIMYALSHGYYDAAKDIFSYLYNTYRTSNRGRLLLQKVPELFFIDALSEKNKPQLRACINNIIQQLSTDDMRYAIRYALSIPRFQSLFTFIYVLNTFTGYLTQDDINRIKLNSKDYSGPILKRIFDITFNTTELPMQEQITQWIRDMTLTPIEMQHALQNGKIDTSYTDSNGNTYLHYLAYAPALPEFISMIAKDVAYHVTNNEGEIPCDIARKQNNTAYIQAIQRIHNTSL